mgnify:CR=1 FL=1
MAHGTYNNPRVGSNGSKGRMKNLVEKLTPGQQIMQGKSPFPKTEINSPRYYDMQKAAAKIEDLKKSELYRPNKGSSRRKAFEKKLND